MSERRQLNRKLKHFLLLVGVISTTLSIASTIATLYLNWINDKDYD